MSSKPLNLRQILFEKKIPFVFLIGIVAVILLVVFMKPFSSVTKKEVVAAKTEPCKENINLIQMTDRELIRPLLMVEMADQSPNLFPVKKIVEENLTTSKQEKKINDASVYLLKLNTGDWIGVNNEKRYSSTGYIRLAILITYLRISESNPGILTQKIFNPPSNLSIERKDPNFVLPKGRYYEVKDLLGYMMIYPDSSSKSLLTENMDKLTFEKLFTDVGLAKPDLEHRKFSINVNEYSRFLHLLFDGHYLSAANSQYALKLLGEDPNRTGMVKLLPPDIKVIHKLSERFANNEYELRESGIIYSNNDSYLLTIFMTGLDNKQLEVSASEIAKTVYDNLN